MWSSENIVECLDNTTTLKNAVVESYLFGHLFSKTTSATLQNDINACKLLIK